jgi:hypothetical protein
MRYRPTTDTAIEALRAEYTHAKNTLKELMNRAVVGRAVLCPRVKNTLEVLRVDIGEMRATLRFYGVLVD